MKELFCRIDRCLGCKTCELACAVEHSSGKNLLSALEEFPRPAHRVIVQSFAEKDDHSRLKSVAVQCRQCIDPMCATACIAGGIVKDAETGIVSFNHDKCVGCWSCTMVCPFGAIIRDKTSHIAVKCDRCEGRPIPACVEACPVKALVVCEPEEFDRVYREEEAAV